MDDSKKITFFALADARGKNMPFGIRSDDRSKHMYIIGKTGMGKSTLLENLAVQDIQNGEGIAFIDPHGKTAETLLDYVPEHRIKDVLYFAPFDMEHPISFNVLEDVDPDKRFLVVNGLMSTFEKIWEDAWSARMAYILSNTLLALLEFPGATLLGVNRMLADKVYRKTVVDNITDPSVKAFWIEEFGKYTEKFAAEATPAIQNKVGQFTSNPLVRNLIGQTRSSFDIREMMDSGKIMIINLSKGRVGEGNANLIGSMLITKMYLAAMSRADMSPAKLAQMPQFNLYVDEFQSFANKSFADILSEARKYKLSLTIAHQYIEQMSEEVRAAVFGNVGTMITFRVGAYDADILEKEFSPYFTAENLVNLGFAQIYLKLMIDGVSSHPFSARTMGPIKPPDVSHKDAVVAASRAAFSLPRAEVEAKIKDWHEDDFGPNQRKANDAPLREGYGQQSFSAERPSSDRPMNDRPAQRSRVAAPTNVSQSAAPTQSRVSRVAPSRASDSRNNDVRDTPRREDFPAEPPAKIVIPEEVRHAIVEQERESPSHTSERVDTVSKTTSPTVPKISTLAPRDHQGYQEQKKNKLEDRKMTKGPSEKNLSSLREALSSVMGPSKSPLSEAIEQAKTEAPVQNQAQPRTSPQVRPVSVVPQPVAVPKQAEATRHFQSHPHSQHQHPKPQSHATSHVSDLREKVHHHQDADEGFADLLREQLEMVVAQKDTKIFARELPKETPRETPEVKKQPKEIKEVLKEIPEDVLKKVLE